MNSTLPLHEKVTENAEHVILKRGRGEVCVYDGHQYYKNRKFPSGLAIWRCSTKRDGKFICTGSLTIRAEKIIKQKSHIEDCKKNHAKNWVDLKISQCKLNVAKDLSKSVVKHFKEAKIDLKNEGMHFLHELPRFKSVKSSLYNRRNKEAGVSKIFFKYATEVEIPPQFKSFLLADYDCNGTRIICFCSEKMRTILPNAKELFSDGTFKACPPCFKQIYKIHAEFSSSTQKTNVIPVIYALMSNATKTSYEILFHIIKSQIPAWQPTDFNIDFEEATRQALLKVFPSIKVHGCFYHFINSIYRKSKQLGYEKKKWAKKIIAMIKVLPLLPLTHIKDGWAYIKQTMVTYKCVMEDFISFFENYWLKNDDFIEMWCVFGQRHRTTNNVEAWHLNLNNNCNIRNMNIMKILLAFQEDAALSELAVHDVEQDRRENRCRNSISNDEVINEVQMMLIHGEISIGTFLQMLR